MENDAEFPQFFESSLAVGGPGVGVALLPVLGDLRGVLDELRRGAAVTPPTLDQGAGGDVDLADRDLRIFPPAAARGSGPRTGSSRRIELSAA